ncbi:PREDICTED: V-type proton ATPase 116 kDa subunit a isoform 1-like [Papilio polytes]|uniref:V-type proton ATPase 116 kDa subunit a isoform 1-like n=1 Tax=Papilio polytes TaxID=76194 RepID=UPI000675D94F|nr:PREDICTED: V-type proton ATPase 116 kDa subunit a isoform 1-like [Papilio polytes]
MGAMFRSEEMALCQLFIQPEAAYTSVSELGEAGSVQFRDLNPDVNAFQRKFVNEVRRCDEMERKLRYIEAEVHKDGVHVPEVKEPPRAPNPREIIDLEAHLEKTENEILELSHNAVNLKQNYLELTELKHVLEKTEAFFIAQEEIGMDSLTKSLISDEAVGQQAATRGRLGFVAGVVLNQTRDHRQRVLVSVAKELASWSIMVRKMKAIYHTLNLFNMDVTKKCLIGECWVPTADLPNVQKALADGSNACGSSIPSFLNCIETEEEPPTFNRTNRFTRGFQNLIDSYGVASYRECNPALYTIITFPFLFAVMFGDLGHGCIMAMFGAWMVIKEVSLAAKKSNNEIWNIFFAGRYIILLMGCFSMYTGLVYNDIFSKSMNIFGSTWYVPYDNETLEKSASLTLDPKASYINKPYFIGIDPIWQSADNKIIFLNSYKMKLSIIFGVLHMIFGVCMSVVNYNFFKRRYSIILEFIPQIVFLCLLFLYMVFMMFYKWVAYSTFSTDEAYKQGCAPSVLILFINMMLFSSTEPEAGCKEFMFEAHAELSEVLWDMVLAFGLRDPTYVGGIKLYVAFCFWALFTLAILVMMEGLSAFLHTLRLHWVEFMSKFYSGLGYIFQPFCFKTILENDDEE